MAKGIGGEDGPSIWTFLCVILVWKWFQSETAKLEKGVKGIFHVGENTSGPLQKQTSSEIAKLENEIKRIPVTASRLKFPLVHYTSLAEMIWTEVNSWTPNVARIFEELEPLSVYELRAVAHEFGTRETSVFGLLTLKTYTIFTAFDSILRDATFDKGLTRMHNIWHKTGLWV